jgi:hypothetical protein
VFSQAVKVTTMSVSSSVSIGGSQSLMSSVIA